MSYIGSLDYLYFIREMHVYTGCIGGLLANTVYRLDVTGCIGGLLANTVYRLEVTVSVLLRLDSPHLPSTGVAGSGQLHGKSSVLRARS